MGHNVLRFKNAVTPKQSGELARIRVLGGPDRGVIFILKSERVTIGRGDENDIILADLKVSRKHIEINLQNMTAKDLGSSHGFVLNGSLIASAASNGLKNSDKIGMGETVLEFVASNEFGATRMILNQPQTSSVPVGSGSSGLTQFIPRPSGQNASLFGLNSAGKGVPPGAKIGSQGFLEKNKRFLFVLGALMFIAALLPEVEQKQRIKRNKYLEPKDVDAARSLSSVGQSKADPNVMKKAEVHYREGFREFREKNYLRALSSFETALQIYPNHSLARVYIDSTKKEMENEAKQHFESAKKDEEANRLKSARSHYDSIRRLYFKDQSNPIFKDADAQMLLIENKIKEVEEVK